MIVVQLGFFSLLRLAKRPSEITQATENCFHNYQCAAKKFKFSQTLFYSLKTQNKYCDILPESRNIGVGMYGYS
jgi:hypothetical protein